MFQSIPEHQTSQCPWQRVTSSLQRRLARGHVIGIPLAWFPRLLHASPEQRSNYELSYKGIHWEGLDEDISVDGLLAGRGDMTRPTKIAA